MDKILAKLVEIKVAVGSGVAFVVASLDEVKDRAMGVKGLIVGAAVLVSTLVVESAKSAVEEMRSSQD